MCCGFAVTIDWTPREKVIIACVGENCRNRRRRESKVAVFVKSMCLLDGEMLEYV